MKKEVKQKIKIIPLGVKIIAILFYVYAGLEIISLILNFLILGQFGSIGGGLLFAALLVSPYIWNIILPIVIAICSIILYIFIGRGLWKAKKWARIIAIILSLLIIVAGILNMIKGKEIDFRHILNLIIFLVVGGYLLLSKDVKRAFA